MSEKTTDIALPFSDVWRQMEFEIERLRAENEKLREDFNANIGFLKQNIDALRIENESFEDANIEYRCMIKKMIDERESLKKALRAILNDVGYHNPMRMTTEISDKILEDAAGALNDNF